MKCTNCGAECKDTQTFCLNCGTPLHTDQRLNEIEAELANNVGAMLDAFDDDDEDEIEDFVVKFDESVFEDEALKVQKELQVDNIYSGSRKTAQEEGTEEEWEYDEDKYFDNMQMEDVIEDDLQESRQREKKNKKSTKKKKKNKKKIVIICVVVVIILAVGIAGGIYILDNMHFNLTSYEDYYKIASKEYDKEDYNAALKDSQSALRKAQRAYETAGDDEDKKEAAEKKLVQVRELINDIYEKTQKTDDDYADNMLEIVQLDNSLSEYFVKLAKYYSDNKPPKVLTDFLRTVEDDNTAVIEALKDYIVPVPTADKESGSYSAQFAVTLASNDNSVIWYTVDGRDPSTYGVKYTEPIKITAFRTADDTNTEKGVTVLKAITINSDQVESKVKEFTYEVVLSSAEPIVTPDSGYYTDYTEIKIDVPQGSKCYYTIAEGSAKPADPNETSELYIADESQVPEGGKYKPLQIPRGTHIMKFVIIDEFGIASDIAVRSYNLEIPRNVSLNDAEKRVDDMLLTENIVNAEGKNAANNIVKAEWDETIIVDNNEYYIVYAVEKTEAGEEVSRTMYLVDSYNKDRKVIKDVKYENGQYVIPEDTGTSEKEN